MAVTIIHGLPDVCRNAAAEIYWHAFGKKLGRVMGPAEKAHTYLLRAMQADHVLAALDERGRLLGIAGFKTPAGAFADGSFADLKAAYGRVGAAWRLNALRLLHSEIDNERFLVDGICVAPEMRGQGVGTALITALCAEAALRGYASVRLDVADHNPRAKALYERLGFQALGSQPAGILRPLFGFSAITTMVRALD